MKINLLFTRSKPSWLLAFGILLFSSINSSNLLAQCTNSSPYGSVTLTTTANSSGTINCNYASEYGTWSGVTAGYGYTTTSTNTNDYITVRSGSSSGPVVAHGPQPLTWFAQSTATHYIHINTNSSCGTASGCRNITTTVLGTGCANSTPYGTGTLSSTVPSATISCQYASEYGTWNGIVAGNNYTTTSTNTSDFLTVRSGSATGPIVAFGTTPLNWNAITTGTHYIHVNTNSSCGTASGCRNITTTYNAQCPAPNGLASINIGTTTFTLVFNETGNATSWQISIDTNGTFLGNYIVSNDTNSGSGFYAATNYSWKVRAICGSGDTSAWSSTANFTTLCNAIAAPYTENFDGLALTSPYTALPTCWGVQTGPDYWYVTNDVVNTGHTYLPNIGDHTTGSANYMWIDASSNITANQMVSPLIDMSGLTNPYAGFWFASNNTTNTVNHTIALDAWDGSAWVNIATETGNFSSWVEVGAAVPTTIPSTTKFRIYAIANPNGTSANYYYNDLGVDDFFVIEAPACPAPSNLTATTVTANGATVSWTENGSSTSWQIEYGTSGFTQGSGNLSIVTANPTSLTGLTFETNYQVYVRAICGAGDTSAWAGPLSFFTGYCTASPSSVDGTGIVNVSMDTINNTTGAEPGNYGNYSAMVATAGQGGVLPISITLATGYTYDMWAWVDWNNDLDFSDPGEEFFLGTSTNVNPTTFTSSITIPSNASLGNHRIRIGGADSGLGTTSPSNPCYTGSWGSFEDYTLNIVTLQQIDLTITWDQTNLIDYTTIAFEGGQSAADVDPTNGNNNVLRFIKPTGAQPWAGVTLSTTAGLANPVPFTSTATTVSAKIYSPAAGMTIMLKTEVVGSPTVFAEATATTTVANSWETLVFDFGNASNGSLNLANSYELLSLFPDFLSPAAGDTFYVDSVYFGGFVPYPDANFTSVSAPAANNCSSNDTLMCIIGNAGNTILSNFDIITSQNGGQNDTTAYQNSIAVGGADTVYIPVTLVPGNNVFNVYTYVMGDVDNTNDSNSTSIFYSFLYTSTTSTDATCPESTDGLAEITVDSGGVGPFTYMWSDPNMTTTSSIQNLALGTYTVTATDANGCSTTEQITINALNATPSISISGDDTICGNGTSTLDAGAGFSTYAWSNSGQNQTIDVSSTGTFTVTVTDTNGCTADDSFDVFAYDQINLTTSGVDVTCEGGSDGIVAATATGGTSTFEYEWNDGAMTSSNIDVEAGTYHVTVTDAAGCSAEDSITIGFTNAAPAISLGSGSIAGEGSVNLDAGAGYADYAWSDGSTTSEITVTSSGEYSCTVTDTNGCSASDTINVEIWPLGIGQNEATSLSVYPNPSTGVFNLDITNVPVDQVQVTVMSINGQVISTSTLNASNGKVNNAVDLSNEASGIYLMQLNINGAITTVRLNVQ